NTYAPPQSHTPAHPSNNPDPATYPSAIPGYYGDNDPDPMNTYAPPQSHTPAHPSNNPDPATYPSAIPGDYGDNDPDP
ncbi:hypothetical protein RM446_24800, partial [Streptomonospora sp. DSM 45055]|nr:hypothetical protein [Streptomonospora sp. DSM 45055]